ncbi:hypothetical protein N431DRAFT_432287 [Stipitochalara longipes BDJ]|nr:hypothetical protein N431DRAFT_432287 [Stipitochalara longipes BDJ]
MASFDLFPKLPASIRHDVWRQAAAVPRVVGIYEAHVIGWTVDWKRRKETRMVSTTRPPAMLSACREAREIGLTVYKRMEEGMQNGPPTSRDVPIYINPEVDIMYRGRMSCRKGDMYKLRCRDWSKDTEPLAMSKTLAIDARGVTRFQEPPAEVVMDICENYPKEEWSELMENMFLNIHYGTMEEVIKCAEKGVREIIYVVGNDDDLSEITLVPLPDEPSQLSARELEVVQAADEFGSGVGRYWKQKDVTWPLPTFKVMKVERKPLKEFTLFPHLPMEIQLLIWDFAAVNYPKVHTMISDDDNISTGTGPEAFNYRAPAMAHACRNSRNAIWKDLDMSKLDDKTMIHEPLNDVILLRKQGIETSYRDFAKKQYTSIGIIYDEKRSWNMISGADAKTFVGLKRIFILLGGHRASCEMTMVPIPEAQPPRGKVYEWSKTSSARMCAHILREDLEKQSKKWKAYQRRRVKQGKSSPDWVVPKVEVAHLKPICEVVSPYSY